ncbi:hypothetical protein Droror1_Dr00025109, partial [Drosera rotundifolia]
MQFGELAVGPWTDPCYWAGFKDQRERRERVWAASFWSGSVAVDPGSVGLKDREVEGRRSRWWWIRVLYPLILMVDCVRS